MEPSFSERVFKDGYELMSFPTIKTKQLAETIAQALSLDREEINDINKKYFVLVSRLRFSALDHYTERDIESFFEHCICDALALEEFDPQLRLKAKLINILITERDAFKKRLREALTRNTQVISSVPIQVNGKTLPGTIQNWFKDYFGKVGTGYVNTVDQAQYFFSNSNFVKLSAIEKNKLRQLFTLYEWLKLSSMTLEGVEESVGFVDKNGDLIDFQQGIPIRLSVETSKKAVDPRQKLLQEFLGPEQERTLLHKEESSLEKAATDNLASLKPVFLAALNQKDKYKAIAVLRIIAQKGNLLEEFRQDEKISELFKTLLKKQYRPEILADFQRQGFTAPYLSLFLQRVLKNQLGMSNSDSARIGVQLENILVHRGSTQVQGMVYGDLVTGQYVWQELKDDGVRLLLEKVK